MSEKVRSVRVGEKLFLSDDRGPMRYLDPAKNEAVDDKTGQRNESGINYE